MEKTELKELRNQQNVFWRKLKLISIGITLLFLLIAVIVTVVKTVDFIDNIGKWDQTSSNTPNWSKYPGIAPITNSFYAYPQMGQLPSWLPANLKEINVQGIKNLPGYIDSLHSRYETMSGTLDMATAPTIILGIFCLVRIACNGLYIARAYIDNKTILISKEVFVARIVRHSISIVCWFAMMIICFVLKGVLTDALKPLSDPLKSKIDQIDQILNYRVVPLPGVNVIIPDPKNYPDFKITYENYFRATLVNYVKDLPEPINASNEMIDKMIPVQVSLGIFMIGLMLNNLISGSIEKKKIRNYNGQINNDEGSIASQNASEREEIKRLKEEAKKEKLRAKKEAKENKNNSDDATDAADYSADSAE